MGQEGLESDIPEGARILLDTTVLAAYLDSSEAVHPVAAHVLDSMVATGRNPAVVSMITVMEILVRPMRQRPKTHATVLQFLSHHANLELVPVDVQMAQDAAMLRADHGFRPPDAPVIGTGLACQVGYLVTNDRDWESKLSGLQERIQVRTLASYLPFP